MIEIDLFGNIIAETEDQVATVDKISPFSYNNNISDKKYPADFSGYNPYLTNLSFSQRNDTVFYANEMNKYHSLPEKAQFDFYFHSLPKKKYFAKWAKPPKHDHLDAVKSYYNVSSKIALQYQQALTTAQLKEISKWFDTKEGGKTKSNK